MAVVPFVYSLDGRILDIEEPFEQRHGTRKQNSHSQTRSAQCASFCGAMIFIDTARQTRTCIKYLPAVCSEWLRPFASPHNVQSRAQARLRKAAMRRLAEHDATDKQIAAVSGHKTLREVERYTAAADQKRLAKAGMDKIRGKKRTWIA
ncbi:hypothetical protein V1282_006884 [Nitrobacteraceae bacterium AZCC 2146]